MARASLRQSAVRVSTRRVQFWTALVCLAVGGFVPRLSLDACGLSGVPASFLLLLYARQVLRTLLENRYLCMSRGSVPKSRHWGWHTIDELPESQWRVFMRMSRSTYAHLSELLVTQDEVAQPRRRRRPAIPQDVQQRVALFRLGQDGNGACEIFLATCAWVEVVCAFCSVLFPTFANLFLRSVRVCGKHVRYEPRVCRQGHQQVYSTRGTPVRGAHCLA